MPRSSDLTYEVSKAYTDRRCYLLGYAESYFLHTAAYIVQQPHGTNISTLRCNSASALKG